MPRRAPAKRAAWKPDSIFRSSEVPYVERGGAAGFSTIPPPSLITPSPAALKTSAVIRK